MHPTTPPTPKQNRILAALAINQYARLLDDLQPVTLAAGQVLCQAGGSLNAVWFPADCIVSLLSTTSGDDSCEVGMTGAEGLVGIWLALGSERSPCKLVVQRPGKAWRLPAEIMRWEVEQGGALQRIALLYAQSLLAQMAQSLLCNRHHPIERQVSRWLLQRLDRQSGLQISITQDQIAALLGVRREAVTYAARKLQGSGVIEYHRGQISVLDRDRLAAGACACYHQARQEDARLLSEASLIPANERLRPNPASLRQRAEARLRQQLAAQPAAGTDDAADSAHLLHELEIHRIELEIHNEALRHAYGEADALGERYADIYDFAPVGYFTLDQQGVIVDLNLAGAILLGIKRTEKSRHRFLSHVEAHARDEFSAFVAAVLQSDSRHVCRIPLAANAQRPVAMVRIEAVPDESGRECRMVVIDMTEQYAIQQALEQSELRFRQFIGNLPLASGISHQTKRPDD